MNILEEILMNKLHQAADSMDSPNATAIDEFDNMRNMLARVNPEDVVGTVTLTVSREVREDGEKGISMVSCVLGSGMACETLVKLGELMIAQSVMQRALDDGDVSNPIEREILKELLAGTEATGQVYTPEELVKQKH